MSKLELNTIIDVDVMILGGGVAGLAASYRATELKRKSVVFEMNSSLGGLLDNFEVEGFRFDNAIHLSFASESEVRKVFDKTSYHIHSSDSTCFEEGNWLKHPVQNNLYPLPIEEKVSLIDSFFKRDTNKLSDAKDYDSWLRCQYGKDLSERFPIKYTKKYWATEPAKLSTTWIGDRMRTADPKEILFGAFTNETPNTYYIKEMRYPKEGGYKAFLTPLIEATDYVLNSRVTRIDLAKKKVEFNGTHWVKYNKLISSLPLPVFIQVCESVPEKVKEAVSRLEVTSINLISVGLNEKIVDKLWFYIYDEDICASRVYSPSMKSPENAPSNKSSLQFEIYSRGNKSVFTEEELIENTKYALKKMKICNENQIQFIHHKHLAWGNIIFDIGMEENREKVIDYLKSFDVTGCGRFGEWKYFWSNQSFMSGYQSL